MLNKKCCRLSLLDPLQLETCVYSLILKLCFTFMLYVFCMLEHHVAYHTNSQVANNKVQTHLESKTRVHEEEMKVLITMNQELEAMKVIVAY